MSKRIEVRRKGNEFCAIEVRLNNGRLSICGSAGHIAKGRTSRYDEVYKTVGKEVYILTSCGQIREELTEFFPDYAKFFDWHLNDLHPECIHQEEERGDTWTNNPGSICCECGYKLGSAWTSRELPEYVVAWAQTVGSAE